MGIEVQHLQFTKYQSDQILLNGIKKIIYLLKGGQIKVDGSKYDENR